MTPEALRSLIAGAETLDVEFKGEVEVHSGELYQCSGVPKTIYQGFMRAASRGSYFHDHIKGRYPNRQVR